MNGYTNISIYSNPNYPEHTLFKTSVYFGATLAKDRSISELIGFVQLNKKGYWEVYEAANYVDEETGEVFESNQLVHVAKTEIKALNFAKIHFITGYDVPKPRKKK